MENRPIKVLNAFQPFLHILNVFDVENRRARDRRRLYSNIRDMMALGALLLIVALTISCVFWFCVKRKFNLIEIAQPTSLALCLLQLILMYLTLMMGSRRVIDVIARIQNILNGSKILFILLEFRSIFD